MTFHSCILERIRATRIIAQEDKVHIIHVSYFSINIANMIEPSPIRLDGQV